jgi:hypothetical protein
LLGAYEEAAARLRTVIERADAMSDPTNAVRARASLGWLLSRSQRLDEARAVIVAGSEQLDLVAEPYARASFLRAQASLMTAEGRRRDAIATIRRAVESFRAAGSLRDTAETLVLLAGRHIEEGELSLAERAARDADAALQAAGHVHASASLSVLFGALAQERGDFALSRRHFEAGLEEAKRTGRRAWEGITLMRMGQLDLEAGILDRAAEAFGAAREILEAAGDKRTLALVCAGEGVIAAFEENVAEASDRLLTAKRLAERLGPVERAHVEILANVLISDDRSAERASEQALDDQNLTSMSDELRYASRILALWKSRGARTATQRPTSRPSNQLHVGPEALWFELDGARVDLSRRRSLRLLLLHLAHLREAAPDREASAAELCSAGWPGERPRASAATLRVRVALAELRKLGLRALIIRQRGGWKLVSTSPISWERK